MAFGSALLVSFPRICLKLLWIKSRTLPSYNVKRTLKWLNVNTEATICASKMKIRMLLRVMLSHGTVIVLSWHRNYLLPLFWVGNFNAAGIEIQNAGNLDLQFVFLIMFSIDAATCHLFSATALDWYPVFWEVVIHWLFSVLPFDFGAKHIKF